MHGGGGNDGGWDDLRIYLGLFFFSSQGHKQEVFQTVHDLTLESLTPE